MEETLESFSSVNAAINFDSCCGLFSCQDDVAMSFPSVLKTIAEHLKHYYASKKDLFEMWFSKKKKKKNTVWQTFK